MTATSIVRQAHCDRQSGLVPVDEARRRLLAGVSPVSGAERIALAAALGRVLAEDLAAPLPLPPFDRAAVDGYGIGSAAAGPFRLVGRIAAGGAGPSRITADEAVRLLTGAPVPDGVAAVAMSEGCTLRGEAVQCSAAPRPGENIRRRGEDAEQGEILLRGGTPVDPRHLALLASAGVATVHVRRRVRVAVLSAGDELRAPGDAPGPSAIFDSNRPMLLALLAGAGVEVVDLGIQPDDRGAIAAALARAEGCDAILASGGVAGSEADHLLGALRDAGGEGAWMPIALKPGKPLVFGRLGAARCLFLPGNPVAALVGTLLFAHPLLAALAGTPATEPCWLPAVSDDGWERRPGREEFAPARIVGTDDEHRLRVRRVARAGSARLVPLVAADGLLRVAANHGVVEAGARVSFLPFSLAGAPPVR